MCLSSSVSEIVSFQTGLRVERTPECARPGADKLIDQVFLEVVGSKHVVTKHGFSVASCPFREEVLRNMY